MLPFLSDIKSIQKKLFSIALVCLALLSNPSYSQQIFSGVVKDSVSAEVISFVNISDESTNEIYVSDQNGKFEIEVNDNSRLEFKFSAVGYKTSLIKLIDAEEQNIILLQAAVEKLDEISVSPPQPSKEAKKVLKKSMRELKRNFSISEQSAYFSHRIYENDQCTKIIDGDIVFRDNTGYFKNLSPVKRREEIEFTSKRMTLDYSKTDLHFQRGYFDVYNDEFAFLLKNVLKYKVSNSKYDYYMDHKSESDDLIRFVITAFDKKPADRGAFSDFFDIKYKITYSKGKDLYQLNEVVLNYISTYNSKFFNHHENSFFSISITKNSSLDRIQHGVIQSNLYDEKSNTVKLLQTLDFEMTDIQNSKTKIESIAKNSSQLHLENSMKRDQEFYAQQEQLDLEKVRSIIQNNRSQKETYLILWNNYEQLMPLMGLNNIVDGSKVDLIFIGDIGSHKEWRFIKEGMDVKYFYNFNLPNLKSEILQEEASYPTFLKYSVEGDSSVQNTPFEIFLQE